MSRLELLRSKANSLPETPGVYIMKNQSGDIIYVGKSKKLKNRVSSYFHTYHTNIKTAKMVSLVYDFDFYLCNTEMEALTLENTLIKKHTPKYNIRLKDSKTYPYIKVTNEPFPRLTVTRERTSDKGKYFGPYSSAQSAYAALQTVMRIFNLPSCKRTFPKDIGKGRPCLYREMGRCCAPCASDIDEVGYNELIKYAEKILDGNIKDTKSALEEKMLAFADNLEFEKAAAVRDNISALERLKEKQKVVADAKINRDVFAIYKGDEISVLATLCIREGALIAKNEFILSSLDFMQKDEISSFIAAYYDRTMNVPSEIMLDFALEGDETELLSEYLTILKGKKVYVKIPERGDGRAICDMALENAKEAARQYILEGEREDKSLKRLAELAGISPMPERIEAYDISNIGNENITASMVVYEGGRLKKSDYRIFTVRRGEGADDYASMKEALTRRLLHIGDGTASLGMRPDLLLIDGGKGHVNTVKDVLKQLQIDIPALGMVKDDYHKTRALTDGENDISIAQEMQVYTFIYKLQEEAHRFAVKSSQRAKTKTLTHSSLERIDGIGPKKAKALLKAMTLSEIKASDLDALKKIKGISEKDAENIYNYYKKQRKD